LTPHKNSKNYGKTLLRAGNRLKQYVFDVRSVFRTQTGDVTNKAKEYLKSLWLSRLTNIERISETGIPENYHSLHHFISDSPWDAFELMESVRKKVSESLPKRKLTGLHIDESGAGKKGKKSVAVTNQYCGNLGKVDNCQVAVYASLNTGDFASIVESRLYLPKEWTILFLVDYHDVQFTLPKARHFCQSLPLALASSQAFIWVYLGSAKFQAVM